MKKAMTGSIAEENYSRFSHGIFFMLFIASMVLAIPVRAPATDLYIFTDDGGEPLYTNVRAPGSMRVHYPLVFRKRNISKNTAGNDLKYLSYEPAISSAGERYSVDPDLVRALIKIESNYNHLAVSPKGAMGLMQLMPGTARELGVADPFDPAANIHGGVLYLRQMLDAMQGDLSLGLAAYNAGLARVQEKKRIPAILETRNYVRQVLDNYEKAKALNKMPAAQ
jgi:soluble lytic murein transglycosylase-like protein